MATLKDLIDGLELFRSILGDDVHISGVGHDIIYACCDEIALSNEQRATLEDAGWFVDDEAWAHFA